MNCGRYWISTNVTDPMSAGKWKVSDWTIRIFLEKKRHKPSKEPRNILTLLTAMPRDFEWVGQESFPGG
jgi:hypothetical protein